MPRRSNNLLQERVLIPVPHAQTTVTVAEKVWAVPAGRTLRVDKVWYNNPTGLAADAANYYTITVKQGSTVIASWSTLTGSNGALTADTPVALVLSATDADAVAAESVVLSISLAKTGTQTLPAGRFMIEARLL